MTPQTARRWAAVLEGTFQWIAIPAFHPNAVKRVSSKPKGYLIDTGLVCHHSLISAPAALGGHPLLGALFETAMVHEIRKQNSCLPGGGAFYHWRSVGGAEVDLLLGDSSKARRELGWAPRVTFKDLVRLMVEADLEMAGRHLDRPR